MTSDPTNSAPLPVAAPPPHGSTECEPRDGTAATAVAEVDLGALAANYAWLSARAAPARVAGVVKADAYGLGAAAVARRLAQCGCESFFVANLAEAVALRRTEAAARIYTLGGLPPHGAETCLRHAIVPVLNTAEELDAWLAVAPGRPAALQIDTGMTRAGLDAADVERLARDRARLAALRLELVLTHLACADEPAHPANARQVQRFERLCGLLPPAPTSIGNSAGTLLGPATRGDLVRPGIALYGGRPLATGDNPLREVLRFRARVLQLRDVHEPTPVGYGGTWTARPPARLAVVGAGYADGYPRVLGGRGIAIAGGRRVPVVGRVSMDLVTLDVTAVPREALRVGDWVHLIGGGVSIDEVAAAADTLPYELLTRLAPRVPRRYA